MNNKLPPVQLGNGTRFNKNKLRNVAMKISCPNCKKVRDIRPEEIIGRLYICADCHHIFQWAWHKTERKPQSEKEKCSPVKGDAS